VTPSRRSKPAINQPSCLADAPACYITQNIQRHCHREDFDERTCSRRRREVCTVTARHQSVTPPWRERPGPASCLQNRRCRQTAVRVQRMVGFATADDRHRIEAVVRRGVRAGLYPVDGAAQLVQEHDGSISLCTASNTCFTDFFLLKTIMTINCGLGHIPLPFLYHGPSS